MALFLRFATAGAFWDHSSFFVNPDDDALQSLLDERLVPRQICFNHITNTQLWLSIIWKITVTHNSHNVWRTTRWMWSILMVKMIVNTCTTVVLPYGRLIRYKLDAPNPNPKSVERVSLGCEETWLWYWHLQYYDLWFAGTAGDPIIQPVFQAFRVCAGLKCHDGEWGFQSDPWAHQKRLELWVCNSVQENPCICSRGCQNVFFSSPKQKRWDKHCLLERALSSWQPVWCRTDQNFSLPAENLLSSHSRTTSRKHSAVATKKLLSTTFAKTQGFQVQGWKKEETFDTLRWWLRPGKCPNCLCSIIWTQFNLAFHCMLIVVWVWLWPAAPSTQ